MQNAASVSHRHRFTFREFMTVAVKVDCGPRSEHNAPSPYLSASVFLGSVCNARASICNYLHEVYYFADRIVLFYYS
jgi:hypothetical protein